MQRPVDQGLLRHLRVVPRVGAVVVIAMLGTLAGACTGSEDGSAAPDSSVASAASPASASASADSSGLDQAAGEATDQSATGSAAAESAFPSGVEQEICTELSVEQVNTLLRKFLAGGSVTVEQGASYDTERKGYRCAYRLPQGPLEHGSLVIDRSTYAEDYSSERGVYDTTCTIGGSSRNEVYSTAQSCLFALYEADYNTNGTAIEGTTVPDYPGGTVTDGQLEVITAPKGPYWYDVSLSGVEGDTAFDSMLVNIAKALGAGDDTQ